MSSKWAVTLGGIVLALAGTTAQASLFPLTISDIAGRSVTLSHEPKRVVVQDGRDILTLALLDRDNPFARVVAWNNLLAKNDPAAWNNMLKKWPQASKIINMNFSDDGQVNIEELLAQQPDLLIAQLRSKTVLQQTGVLDKLAQLHIPVVFIDLEEDPVKHTMASVSLLGKTLNREQEAAQYTAFYQQHLQAVEHVIAKEKNHPVVFVEALAGKAGLDACCFTHGKKGWGDLVEAAGGQNLGSKLLPGPTGSIAMEKLLAAQPDIYLLTSSQWTNKGSMAIPFGYGSSQARVDAAFGPLMQRIGFQQLKAYKTKQVYGIYHQFYNHPYNIVAVEHLAKDFYPAAFKSLNPNQTYQQIIQQFTHIPAEPVMTGSQAPIH